MSLDARSITIGLSVVLLAAIAWVLVSNNDEGQGTTTVVAVTTTSSPSTSTATTEVTTTNAPSTTAAASTTSTAATTATTPTATTSSVASTTSSPTRSTVTIPPPLEEPDLTMCRENDLPDRLCRWVGVAYPNVNADPNEQPLRFLRQIADHFNWSNANPVTGHGVLDEATTGDLLEELTRRTRDQLERGEIGLHRDAIEGPVEVLSGEGTLTIEATLVASPGAVIDRDGNLVREVEPDPPVRWRFEALETPRGWRVGEMGPAQ